MSSSRREPSLIALQLLDCIDEGRGASRWDLIKVLGNTSQFQHWVEDFMMREGFDEEREESGRRHYVKTESGELFHRLLRNGNMIKSLLRVSGKRLRRYMPTSGHSFHPRASPLPSRR